MQSDVAHRRFKDRLYAQLSRVGKAVGSPRRLELLELLAQAERTVESLAGETAMSIASTSQHLQALRQAGLVDSRRAGLFVHYRIADPLVSELVKSVRQVAERQLAELDRVVRDYFGDRSSSEPVSMHELLERARHGTVVVIDARPAHEYEAGHVSGAISLPFGEMVDALRSLPKSSDYVAYCRGPYCVYADRAVELLKSKGCRARRLSEGFPEWKAAGMPTSVGVEPGAIA